MDSRTAELPAAVLPLRLAAENDVLTITVLFEDPRLIEPQTTNEMSVAVDEDANQASSTSEQFDFAIDDVTVNGLFEVGFKPRDSPDVCKVVDRMRDMKQQVANRPDGQLRQQLSALWTDSANELHGSLQSIISTDLNS